MSKVRMLSYTYSSKENKKHPSIRVIFIHVCKIILTFWIHTCKISVRWLFMQIKMYFLILENKSYFCKDWDCSSLPTNNPYNTTPQHQNTTQTKKWKKRRDWSLGWLLPVNNSHPTTTSMDQHKEASPKKHHLFSITGSLSSFLQSRHYELVYQWI